MLLFLKKQFCSDDLIQPHRLIFQHFFQGMEAKLKTRNLLLFSIAIYSMLFLFNPDSAAQLPNKTEQSLHDSLGPVIDSTENLLYNIFGDIPGFTAARFYIHKKGKYSLHLIRNAENRAQLLILNIPLSRYRSLSIGTANRISTAKDNRRFDRPLYPVEEEQWKDKSVNKNLLLRDGSQLVVKLERAKTDTLFVTTAGGLQISVPDNKIKEIVDLYGEIQEGEYIRTDPNVSRLFFAPTGRGLKAGHGYFADYFIFFPTLAYGVTDYFTLSGGMSLIPGAKSQLLHFAPKLSIDLSNSMTGGAGFLYMGIPEGEEDISLGYVVTTIGDARQGITLGAGVPLGMTENGIILLVGGELQISQNAKLLSENWIFAGEEITLLSCTGIRFFGERLAVDLGLITSEEAFSEGGFPFLPWVDFSVFFRK